jgi:hypothetical protein
MKNVIPNETYNIMATPLPLEIVGWTLVVVAGIFTVGHIASRIGDRFRDRSNNE